jgi:hypothetical protein
MINIHGMFLNGRTLSQFFVDSTGWTINPQLFSQTWREGILYEQE